MKKRLISLLSLLLAAVMVLVSCSDKKSLKQDDPVTAEGVLSNFFTFNKAEAKPINNAVHLNDELGQTYDDCDDYVIFLKETKDRLNNLTETYSVYSVEEKKVVFTVTNTYADEWGWEDDFGNETHPEKVIDEVEIIDEFEIVYFAVTWTVYTPIDEEIIEEEELEWSYTEREYTEFYDVNGKLITTSHVEDRGNYVDENDYYTIVSLGRTVAVFDNKTGAVVSTYNGDTESTPRLYDFMNDNYNYVLDAPASGISPDTNPILAMNRTKIRVYDKKDALVLEYMYGDQAAAHASFVLENGDILIQYVYLIDDAEYDYFIDGQKANIDTVILDVETGIVTEIADFKYLLQDLYSAEDILRENSDYKFTENVRNIAYAVSPEDDKKYTVFFDNLGNVNFVFDGKLAYEIEDDPNIYNTQCTVLSENRLLVDLASGVTERAIIDNAGKVIAYISDECHVLNNYIVTVNPDYSIVVYDFDMKLVRTLSSQWAENYKNDQDEIKFYGTVGNTILFEITDNYTEDDVPMSRNHTVRINVNHSNTDLTSYSAFADTYGAETDKFVIMRKLSENSNTPVYLVVNERNTVILTVSANDADIAYAEDGTALLRFYTDDGIECYLLDDSNPDMGENFDPDNMKDPDKEEGVPNEGNNGDEGNKDEGGKD